MGRAKILIVEDDEDFRRSLNLRLRAQNYDTTFAGDASAAIAAAAKEQPDIILLDLGLPAGDGFIVLERLQKKAAVACIPVIVITCREPWKNREKALKAGACAFFQKPPDNYELLDAIRNVLAAQSNGHNVNGQTLTTEQATKV
jgi:DNA-binding response OmpR family regulator